MAPDELGGAVGETTNTPPPSSPSPARRTPDDPTRRSDHQRIVRAQPWWTLAPTTSSGPRRLPRMSRWSEVSPRKIAPGGFCRSRTGVSAVELLVGGR